MAGHVSPSFSLPTSHRRNIPSMTKACVGPTSSTILSDAAKRAVDCHVDSGMVLGLGTGRGSCLAIQHLGRRLRDGSLSNITAVPTSAMGASEAKKAGIRIVDYKDSLHIDFAVTDADIVEEDTLAAVISRTKLEDGYSIIQEKTIMKTANNLVLIVSEKQYGKGLLGSIPVLVNTGIWMDAAEEIDDLFLGDAEVWRRSSFGHADPHGGNFPLVTAEGHHVLDLIFTSPILDLAQVAESLDKIDGVVEHGVISRIPSTSIVVSKTGILVVDNFSRIHS